MLKANAAAVDALDSEPPNSKSKTRKSTHGVVAAFPTWMQSGTGRLRKLLRTGKTAAIIEYCNANATVDPNRSVEPESRELDRARL
jgi:hypothetical protein